MKRNQINIVLGVSLILIAAMARIANREMHLYNLAPVAAVGLFSGAILKDKRFAYIMPLLSMLIADIYFELFTRVNGFYGLEQIVNYGALMVVTALGTKMGQPKALKILGMSLAGSVVFFIISNFGSFLSGMYGLTFDGLVTTYTMALPFFKNTVIGDMVGNAVLFGLYFVAIRSLSVKTEKA